MDYRWNSQSLSSVFAVPAAVVDEHIKLAGSVQLKVLLWILRNGQGSFDQEGCSKAIGSTPADCRDALQYWFATGLLLPVEGTAPMAMATVPAAVMMAVTPSADTGKTAPLNTPAGQTTKSFTGSARAETSRPVARPKAVKPQMKEVIAKQKQESEFAYLLDTSSARLGRPVSHGDMETLLYLYETAGLPVEVILMVTEYAIAEGKYHMRYIEKVALDWADRGINTMAAAEQYLCSLERRRQAWLKVSAALELTQSPTVAQSDAAERWVNDWQTDEGLIKLAYEKCREATGKFNSSYMDKILESWRLTGIRTVKEAMEDREPVKPKGKGRSKKETSFDLDEYATMVDSFTPVYQPNAK